MCVFSAGANADSAVGRVRPGECVWHRAAEAAGGEPSIQAQTAGLPGQPAETGPAGP